MYINKIVIDNFGPIEHQQFNLRQDIINLISGNNASGKTQLLASIYSVFFDNTILQYYKESEREGCVYLQVHSGIETIDLIQRHTNSFSQILFKNFNDLSAASKICREKLFFYFPGFERNTRQKYSKKDIQNGYQFLCDLGLRSHHILGTCLAKTETGVLMSLGEQRYLDIVCFLSKIPQDSILIADGILSEMDCSMGNMVLDILMRMKGIQIILAESNYFKEIFSQKDINILHLKKPSEHINPVSYNYKMITYNYNSPLYLKSNNATDKDSVVPVTYKIGDLFPYGENREIELKEIKGKSAQKTIVANAENYINAYLNSFQRVSVGKIFWGVSDDKVITGVKLSYQEIDSIQRELSEALSKFEPFVNPDLYSIKFNPVASLDGEVQPNIYIVEIDVFPHYVSRLYSTSKGEVYVKTPGGKKKLSILQIQDLILQRTKFQKS